MLWSRKHQIEKSWFNRSDKLNYSFLSNIELKRSYKLVNKSQHFNYSSILIVSAFAILAFGTILTFLSCLSTTTFKYLNATSLATLCFFFFLEHVHLFPFLFTKVFSIYFPLSSLSPLSGFLIFLGLKGINKKKQIKNEHNSQKKK